MNVFKFELIGVEFKTVDKINVKYAETINKMYDKYLDMIGLLHNNAITEYEFTIQYIVLYNKVVRYLDKLFQENVIDFDDYNILLSFFEDVN